MKYKILPKQSDNVIENIFLNRGVRDYKEYLKKGKKIQKYSDLENIQVGLNKLMEYVNKPDAIVGIVMDTDVDGIMSSSILFSYLRNHFPDMKIQMFFHKEGKGHGIDKDILFQVVNSTISLLIVPDAGSNDRANCDILLTKKGIVTLVLDHHDISESPTEMIVVNPHISPKYENKNISGTGVTYQFLKALDNHLGVDDADQYLDLVALSIVSDSCDVRTLENRAILDYGFSNIKNNALIKFIEKAQYNGKTIETLTDFSFSVIPLLNATIRSGTMEEIVLMFKAFTEQYEEFDYVKRDKTEIKEDIYTRVARLCTNAKSRQDRAVEKAIEVIKEDINKNDRNKNKMLFVFANSEVDKNFTGLCAIKLASEYNKPCFVIRENDNGYTQFSGSARNFDQSPIADLKSFILSLKTVDWALGHNDAFGIGISKKQLIDTIEKSNEVLKDFDFSKVFNIDLEFDVYEEGIDTKSINSIIAMRKIWGQGLREPNILLKNIRMSSNAISFLGENKTTWKFPIDDYQDAIKFKASPNDEVTVRFNNNDMLWAGEDISMDVVVRATTNNYNGQDKILYVIQDYEVHSLT